MNEHLQTAQARRVSPLVWAIAAVGAALLVIDRWAQVLGFLPYLVLLACPFMQVFIDCGQGDGAHHRPADQPPGAD